MQKQTQQETIAQNEIENAQVQSLTRVPEVIMSLKSGKVDGNDHLVLLVPQDLCR